MRLKRMRSTVATDWKAGAQVTFIKEVTLNTDLKDNRKIKGICSRDQGLCFWWNIASGHFYDYIILRLPRKLVKKFSVLYFRMGWA